MEGLICAVQWWLVLYEWSTVTNLSQAQVVSAVQIFFITCRVACQAWGVDDEAHPTGKEQTSINQCILCLWKEGKILSTNDQKPGLAWQQWSLP